jgi:hypothetical protein
MKSKLFVLLATLALLTAFVPSAAAQVVTAPYTFSDANLNGVYTFQMESANSVFGYCNGITLPNGGCAIPNWVSVSGGNCPTGQTCYSQTTTKFTYGSIAFNGIGNVTIATFYQFNLYDADTVTGPQQAAGNYSILAGGSGTITIYQIGCSSNCGSISMQVHLGDIDPVTGIARGLTVHTIPSSSTSAGDLQVGYGFYQQ